MGTPPWPLVKAATEEYAFPMSEAPPDYQLLARRYLDLWQEQVAAMANDPALAEVLAQGVAMMTQAQSSLMQAATAGAASPVNQTRAADAGSSAASGTSVPDPAGAAPAAAAPDGAAFDADRLARRLAAVEERLAALEARLGEPGGGSAPKPGRRRAKRLD